MNAIVPAGSNGGNGMVPTSFDQAIRFAEMMARSKMVPKHFQGKPEECLVIIEQSMRWEMSPYAVIQCAAMIHERPMYEGKLVAAVVNARGPRFGLQGRLRYTYAGEGDARTISVTGTLDGREETIDVKLKDAKTANEHWKKQPDQQLAYHGARVWARRHMPELMLGVYSPEEFESNRAAAPAEDTFSGTTIEARAEAPVTQAPTVTPAPEPKRQTLSEWLTEVGSALTDAKTADAVDAIVCSEKVQKALDTLRNGALTLLQERIAEAQKRTAPPPVPPIDPSLEGDAAFLDEATGATETDTLDESNTTAILTDIATITIAHATSAAAGTNKRFAEARGRLSAASQTRVDAALSARLAELRVSG